MGANIEPKSRPNLNQILFNGVKSLEFNNPKVKTKETIADQINTEDPEVKGHNATIKKYSKENKPKLLFELIFILDLFNIFILIVYIYRASEK